MDKNPAHIPLQDQPLLMIGLPRTGSSMTAALFEMSGLWLGKTVPGGGPENPKGFFENTVLREHITKPILKALNCDPLGVRNFPKINALPVIPDFKEVVLETIKNEGYQGNQLWGYKDSLMTLLWPIWLHAFPHTTFIIINRREEDVINSCLNTFFMAQHSKDPVFWELFITEYKFRINCLKKVCTQIYELDSEDLIKREYRPIESIMEKLNLTWDKEKADAFIEKKYWHGKV